MQPLRWQPTKFPYPWDSPVKNTGVGCHFFLQCMKVKSESEVTQSCPTLSNPMDCSLPGSSIHGTDFPGKSTGVGGHYLLRIIHEEYSNELTNHKNKLDTGSIYRNQLSFYILEKEILKKILFSVYIKLCLRHFILYFGEGNGTPLQYSCLENPMDGGAW